MSVQSNTETHRARLRAVQSPSGAIGAEGPAAPQPQSPAAGRPFLVEVIGGLRPLGPVARSICIVAGEKAARRLETRAAQLSADLDRLRREEVVSDRQIDAKTRELRDCQAELEGIQAQLADLKAVRA